MENIISVNNNVTQVLDNPSSIHCHVNKNTLSIFLLNIRSLKLHFDELALFLSTQEFNFNIIILGKTWLQHDFKFNLSGYQIVNSIGTLNKSDGITTFIKTIRS